MKTINAIMQFFFEKFVVSESAFEAVPESYRSRLLCHLGIGVVCSALK